MQKILVVEDSLEISSVVTNALAALRVQIIVATSVSDALRQMQNQAFDLIILDLVLPDGDGLDVLSRVRESAEQHKTAVFVLSSKSDISSKISAFSIGADDYMTKPFNLLELRARVESKLKRQTIESGTEENVFVGPFVLEVNKFSVLIKSINKTIHLSPIEFRLLCLFAKRPGNIFSREQILDQIWGSDVHVTDRTIDTHVYTLRKKLGEYGEYIKSVQGEGYRFVESPMLSQQKPAQNADSRSLSN